MSDTVHSRITDVRHDSRLTQKDFAQRLGVSQAYVSSLEKGRRELSANMIDKFMEEFGISPNWLLRGEGPAYLKPNERGAQTFVSLAEATATKAPSPDSALSAHISGERERILPVTVNERNEPNIVLVPVKAQAGYAEQRVEPTYIQELPTISFPDARFRNGTFRAFEISGDSMEPTLYNGDIVVCRHIQDWRWLREMELYVVVMQEDILAKRIRNRLQASKSFELYSDNTFYPPFQVPVSEVLEIWQIFARITLHLPSPHK